MRKWLYDLRKGKGYSGHDLAKMVDCSFQYYYMIERGERRPSYEVATRIADILDFDVKLLMERVSTA